MQAVETYEYEQDCLSVEDKPPALVYLLFSYTRMTLTLSRHIDTRP